MIQIASTAVELLVVVRRATFESTWWLTSHAMLASRMEFGIAHSSRTKSYGAARKTRTSCTTVQDLKPLSGISHSSYSESHYLGIQLSCQQVQLLGKT